MINSLRLYVHYVSASVRGQMQYRWSFVMMSLGHFVASAIEIVGVWALFNRFGSLRGWRLAEVAMFYAIVNIAFALSEGIARGFDVLPGMVKRGDFDRLLLRPRATAFQVAALEFQLMRVGRLAQGLIVLVWALAALDVPWTVGRAVLLAAAVLGGACLFSGLFVLHATLAFWTVESLEIMNTLTYGGNQTAQYPLSIYPPWFRKFFTFVVPLATVSYFPVTVILGRNDQLLGTPAWLAWISPVFGVLFLALSLQVWQFGVRHYRSTGS